MKVLYVLPRYHTNMTSTVKGWLDHGDEVYMICQNKGSLEKPEYVEPVYLGFSKVFVAWLWMHKNIFQRRNPNAGDLFIKYGIPPMRKIKSLIRSIDPDLIIFRERSLYTILTYSYCKREKYKSILYVQNPVYSDSVERKNGIVHNLVYALTPKASISPSRQRGMGIEHKKKDENSFFAPFVVEPGVKPEDKQYFQDGRINILDIGKYEERKNHFMVLRVLKRLIGKYPNLHLTIVGERSGSFAQNYYESLEKWVRENGLSEHVSLFANYSRDEVNECYKKADVFVLASTDESASVSNVEAMTFSLPVICGSDNGTADYTIPGVTGDIFLDRNEDDLLNKLDRIIADKNEIIKMGAAAYEHARNDFSFINYYDAVMKAMEL